ncbi:DUF2793 domain-containing protein [Leptolyngbya sp. 15MV]|nr:DUF2793 domain-containing protein [Leptolyngbya sp. 15MV]
MSDPIVYQSASARFALPFLFAGQAQKEFFVNEALARLDLLLHPAVEGERTAPPDTPGEGQCWLITEPAEGDWHGHAGMIAGYVGGDWTFLAPSPGMRLWDRSTGQALCRMEDQWRRADEPAAPVGGAIVDSEARAAIVNLIASLGHAGIFSRD